MSADRSPGSTPVAGPKSFLFDLNACTGCTACELACAIENGLPWGTSWRQVLSYNPEHLPGAPTFHLSLACNHCESAPCMHHCPALAYRKDPATGAVLLDPEACIGCKYCSWACPYDAPRYRPEAGVMEKCTFCHHRLVEGLPPACVAACPTGALGADDRGSAVGERLVPGFPEADCGAAIRFTPLRPERLSQEVYGAPAAFPLDGGGVGEGSPLPLPMRGPRRKITLGSEWPLLAFTLLGVTLVALVAGAVVGAAALPRSALLLPAFLLGAGASLGLAGLHLGRKSRAWRAVLNLRRSWLSREVALYSAFLALGTAWLFLARSDPGGRFVSVSGRGAPGLGSPGLIALGLIAIGVGFAALFAMDRVYDIVPHPRILGLHSADVVVTGFLLTALFAGSLALAALAAGVKLLLYGVRKLRAPGEGRETRPAWTALRLAAGFILPLPLFLSPLGPSLGDPLLPPTIGWSVALLGVAVGEITDRIEFYLELDAPGPRAR